MCLKKMLWSDKTTELFTRKVDGPLLSKERLEAARAAAKTHAPTLKAAGKDAARGAKAAFTVLGKVFIAIAAVAPSSSQEEDVEATRPDWGYTNGPEGDGYYDGNGVKLHD